MPKRRNIFILGFIFSFLLPITAFAEERISAFTTHIEINVNGSLSVQEEIIYDFGADAVNKHGIFREIPLIYTPAGATESTRIEISSISVSDGKGTLRQTDYEGSGNIVKLRIGDPDTTVTGPQLYVIRYTVWGGLLQHLGSDEFYWNMTGNEWKVPIDRVRGEVVLPAPLPTSVVSYACYIGSSGATSTCASTITTEGTDPNTISKLRFEDSGLGAYQGMTVKIALPKGLVLFSQPNIREGEVFAPPPELNRWWTQSLFGFSLVLPFIVFRVMFNMWWTRGRDPKGRGTIITEYDVPEDLSPLESAVLVHGSVNASAISASIVDLAERGFLKIERIVEKGLIFDSTDYQLIRLSEKYTDLPPAEKLILEKLFETDRVRVSALKNKLSTVVSEAANATYLTLTGKQYFVENPHTVRSTYSIAGLVMCGVAFFLPTLNFSVLLSGIIILGFAWFMPKMTEQGAILRERLLGFKSYLNVTEKDRLNFANAPEKNPTIFEKFLPYAMIFGVEEAWAKQFEGMFIQENKQGAWYSGSGPLNATLFAKEMSAFTESTNHAFASSGGSGGGGSSGGGGGGGGGGSW